MYFLFLHLHMPVPGVLRYLKWESNKEDLSPLKVLPKQTPLKLKLLICQVDDGLICPQVFMIQREQ